MRQSHILAIDTSCDETSVAISQSDCILANQLSSQIQAHKEWGGVVPSLARRKHEELIDLVISRALKYSRKALEDIDYFAVTLGPGLAIALEVGIAKAIELAQKYNKPIVAINHMEGHIYSSLARNSKGNPKHEYNFPLIAVLISGGHTEVVLMRNHGDYEIIGETLDDAIGECFDKVGRMLNLGYPAGPVVEKIAEKGNARRFSLPLPLANSNNPGFSYSGLKTASMKLITDLLPPLNEYGEKFARRQQGYNSIALKIERKEIIANICASFQDAAVAHLVDRLDFILKNKLNDLKIRDMIFAGGVSQNKYLKKILRRKYGKSCHLHFPVNKRLFTDNAGMIAVAAHFNILRNNYTKDYSLLDRKPGWRIGSIG